MRERVWLDVCLLLFYVLATFKVISGRLWLGVGEGEGVE